MLKLRAEIVKNSGEYRGYRLPVCQVYQWELSLGGYYISGQRLEMAERRDTLISYAKRGKCLA
jgi:hypothetical protein